MCDSKAFFGSGLDSHILWMHERATPVQMKDYNNKRKAHGTEPVGYFKCNLCESKACTERDEEIHILWMHAIISKAVKALQKHQVKTHHGRQ